MRGGSCWIRSAKGKNLTTEDTEEPRVRQVKSPTLSHATRQGWGIALSLVLVVIVITEAEQVHQIADGWAVQRDVGILLAGDGIGEVVAAAAAYRSEPPAGFDELQNGHVICIGV